LCENYQKEIAGNMNAERSTWTYNEIRSYNNQKAAKKYKLFYFFYLDGFDFLVCSHLELILKLLILEAIGRNLWMGDQPVSYVHRTTQNQNKRRETSMPQVGLEPLIPVF
jgi:hypothetical protein